MTALDISLLGPLRLLVDGAETEVTRARVRSALALLATAPGQAISQDALIDHLWPTALPADPKAALSVVLSRLRQTLGSQRDNLLVSSGSYRLDAQCDIARFTELIAQGRRAQASVDVVQALTSALALWRGDPLVDIAESDHLSPIIVGLHESRWNAITLRAEALFETSAYDELIAFAEPLAREQPHRERLVACCARALGLVGRKSHALGLIEQSRASLRNELGVSPSPALESVEDTLLLGGLDLLPAEAGARSGTTTQFVNRVEELTSLQQTAGFTIVVGEPGIGKTALLDEAKRSWVGNGRPVFHVRAPLSATRPMHTMSVLIEELAIAAPPGEHENELRAALAKVAPGVADPVGPTLTAVTRDTLVESLTSYIERCVTVNDAVLIIDDCQWLDLVSADVVLRLAKRDRCRLIMATRPDLAGPLATWLAADPDQTPMSQIDELGPLSQEHSLQALQTSLPNATADSAEQMWQRSGGNPLFLSLLIELHAEGHDSSDGLPPNVLIAVQRRIDVLSGRAQTTLQRVALVGSLAPLSVVRQLSPTADSDLDEALAAGLVVADLKADTVEFNHALVREVVLQLIPEGQRVGLHDQIGQIYEFTGAPAATYAYHYEQAVALDSGRAARALLAAATESAQVYAWEDVYETSRRAKQYLGPADALLLARLAILEGQAQRDLHQGGSADDLTAAIELARDIGDHELFADAVLAHFIHGWSIDADQTIQRVDLLEEALGLDVTPEIRIRLAATGAALMSTEHHGHGRILFHQALEDVLTHTDASLQAYVLDMAHWGLSHPDDLGAYGQAVTLFKDVAGADRLLRWGVATSEFSLGIMTFEPGLVDASIEELRQIAASLGPSARDWELAHTESAYAHLLGDYERADHYLAKSLELGRQTTSEQWLLPIYGACLSTLRRSQGRLAELLPLIDSAIASNSEVSAWRSLAAAAAAESGDLERARLEITRASPKGDYSELRPPTVTGEVALLTDAICAVGDSGFAETLFRFAEPFHGRMTWAGVCTYGPLDQSLSRLARLLGDETAADTYQASANADASCFVAE